jgi:ribosomal protein S18 acetylase RimI-like enzyme
VPVHTIMQILSLSPQWDNDIISLFKYSSELLGTSPIFVEDTLRTHFNPPSSYYSNENVMYVAIIDDKLIGFVGICKDEVQHLCVHPEFRRSGVGTALMVYIHIHTRDHDRDRGNNKFTLSCMGNNDVALKFYQSLPFLHYINTTDHVSSRDGRKYQLVHYGN